MAGAEWIIDGQSDLLQPQTLDGARPLHRRWSGADRQQLDREPHPAHRHGPEELAICRQPARRQTGGGHHESDPVRQVERPRSVRLALRELPAKYDKTISAVRGSFYLPTVAAQAAKRVQV